MTIFPPPPPKKTTNRVGFLLFILSQGYSLYTGQKVMSKHAPEEKQKKRSSRRSCGGRV